MPDRAFEFYATKKLGAVGSDLAAVSRFFDEPYYKPTPSLTPLDRGWLLNLASMYLRAQGRLQETLPAVRQSRRIAEEAQQWSNAAVRAANLGETELLVGEVGAAATMAEASVALADRAGGAFQMMLNRAKQGDALHAAGEWEKAADLFADAERRQRDRQPDYPLLYSLQGYRYCDLLLSRGRAAEARDRAAKTVEWVRQHRWLLDVALDTLTLGRAHLALALRNLADGASPETRRGDLRIAASRLDEAVEGLRVSGQNDDVPRGLSARAAFRRAIGDWDGAARDLDEAQEIAEPGPMRLFLCEIALERARLALARIEAFAPLSALVAPSRPPPALPADAAATLGEEARKQLDAARKLISRCGYHRRDAELAELDEVLAGRRRFADLPPRV